MKDTLKKIISEIPHEVTFDSHYVIKQLAENYTEIYNKGQKPSDTNTAAYHGRISIQIRTLCTELIERNQVASYSENIKDNSNECASWKRL